MRRLILSAHSGGGEALGAMLEQMQGLGLPVGMVVLLDAINGPREELPRIQRWLQGRLEADLRALRGRSLDEQRRYLASSLRFRAYYTSTSFYTPLHEALNAFLVDWFAQHEGEFGGPEGEALSLWLRNYQVLPADGGHNQLVGAGYLLEALQVLPADGAAGEAGVARR